MTPARLPRRKHAADNSVLLAAAGYQSPAEDERDQRAAIQAARGMLDALLPGACSDVAVCCYQRDAARAELASGDQLQVRKICSLRQVCVE